MDKFVKAIAETKQGIPNEENIQLLLLAENDKQTLLFNEANQICESIYNNKIKLRGIIEYSNYCKSNCFYCGLRRDNKRVCRYRCTDDEVIGMAKYGIKLGYGTIVLQSGEESIFDVEKLSYLIKKIKESDNVAITLSLGLLNEENYKKLYFAGADRYLMKHETANKKIFEKLRPSTSWKERIEHLRILKEIGFEVGSGMMIGLPYTSLNDLTDDILLLKELKVEMAGMGPFIAHNETPLSYYASGSANLTLNSIAATRLLIKTINLPATTSLGSLENDRRFEALNCGANIIMPNLTLQKYRSHYKIYPNKSSVNIDAKKTYDLAIKIIIKAGKKVALFEK